MVTMDKLITKSNKKTYEWLEKFYEKLFYESNNKRNDFIDDRQIKSLDSSTKNFLSDLYDHFKNNNAIYTTAFKDEFKREPNTTDDKIYTITSNHFGGFGRTTQPQTKLSSLPLPPNDIVNNLIKVFMDKQRKSEIIELGKKFDLIKQ